jgi:oxygen-dependent protoporphyrinogen oxidase
MVERHYGAEMVDRLADPLLSGVYGGEATQLSVRAVLPRFAEMESKYGSLGRAMLSARRKMPRNVTPRPLFTSLKGGMQQMTDALVSKLTPSSLATGAAIESIQKRGASWEVLSSRGPNQFDCVIMAAPTHAAAALLETTNSALRDELAGIGYTSSITINLAYESNIRELLPAGFGFLVPRSESRRLLACTFVHTKFPHRVPANRALLRCFIAGTQNGQLMQAPEEQVVAAVRKELREILGLTAEPVFARVYRWDRAMAQYGVGHLERLERIEQLRARTPGLFLAGNGYRGIGVPDCIRSGNEAAISALASLGVPMPQPEPQASGQRA